MNNKVRNYIEVLFEDVPNSKKANELKEEFLANMSDKFDDYIRQGKTENEAYSIVVNSMGDIDEILAEVMPNEEFFKEAKKYRERNAKNTAIGVALYIIAPTFLIGTTAIGEFFGYDNAFEIIGVMGLLIFIAIATGLIIYTEMSTPPEYKEYEKKYKKQHMSDYNHSTNKLGKITNLYWPSVTFIYLILSFTTGEWGKTWIIWVLAPILRNIIAIIYEKNNIEE